MEDEVRGISACSRARVPALRFDDVSHLLFGSIMRSNRYPLSFAANLFRSSATTTELRLNFAINQFDHHHHDSHSKFRPCWQISAYPDFGPRRSLDRRPRDAFQRFDTSRPIKLGRNWHSLRLTHTLLPDPAAAAAERLYSKVQKELLPPRSHHPSVVDEVAQKSDHSSSSTQKKDRRRRTCCEV